MNNYVEPVTRDYFTLGDKGKRIILIPTPDFDPVAKEYQLFNKKGEENEDIPVEGEIVDLTDSGLILRDVKYRMFPIIFPDNKNTKKILYRTIKAFVLSD